MAPGDLFVCHVLEAADAEMRVLVGTHVEMRGVKALEQQVAQLAQAVDVEEATAPHE